ncbi:STM3941 family protein [Breoghania sp.]|uniref:STM3941 family protein n=1 Tax=Breoghania sp. TaxID=2065378 RepID=UPI00261653D3|nr:STM3941 family protein [Breoghania sp.]MDJ0931987.1 STM3941 family protein [Breoghania sp.]
MILSAKYDRKKLTLLLVACLVFLAVSFELSLQSDPFIYSVAQVAFLFFLILTGLMAYRFTDNREILRIDENGVFDRRLVDQTIPWSAVDDIKEIRLIGPRFFAVISHEPVQSFITSGLKRRMAWLNGKLGFYAIGINTTGLTTNYTEVHEAFAAYAPEHPEDDSDAEGSSAD